MNKELMLDARQIEVKALACQRGSQLILSNISFSATPGELVFLKGPNGAGKSTLLMCLAGLLPYQGEICWHGRDLEQRPGADIHLVGHLPAIKPQLTLSENLTFWANLNEGDPQSVPRALAAAGLGPISDLEARILSAGQTRRLSLARLLVAPRPIWLLDEPSAALDSQGETWLGELMADHLSKGGIIIGATHLDFEIPGFTPKTVILERAA